MFNLLWKCALWWKPLFSAPMLPRFSLQENRCMGNPARACSLLFLRSIYTRRSVRRASDVYKKYVRKYVESTFGTERYGKLWIATEGNPSNGHIEQIIQYSGMNQQFLSGSLSCRSYWTDIVLIVRFGSDVTYTLEVRVETRRVRSNSASPSHTLQGPLSRKSVLRRSQRCLPSSNVTLT